jgi:hypothetical protein
LHPPTDPDVRNFAHFEDEDFESASTGLYRQAYAEIGWSGNAPERF